MATVVLLFVSRSFREICKFFYILSLASFSDICIWLNMQRENDSPQKDQIRRVIDKYGNKNLSLKSVPQKSKRYALDIFTTIVSNFHFILLKLSISKIDCSFSENLDRYSLAICFTRIFHCNIWWLAVFRNSMVFNRILAQ